MFANVYAECLAIPVPELLDDLTVLQQQGQCSDLVLDGVAATDVAQIECKDAWLNKAGCAAAIGNGFMSCEADFCNTTPTPDAPCDLASHCDLTCGFCSSDPND